MNLDRNHSKYCTKPSVISNEVHSGLCALNTVVGGKGVSVASELNAFSDEVVLRQVAQVCVNLFLGFCRAKLELQAMRSRKGISRRSSFKNPLLKCSIQFHMSGLRGVFAWKQKATTDAPDTQFTRIAESQAKKNHLAGWFFLLHFTTFWS